MVVGPCEVHITMVLIAAVPVAPGCQVPADFAARIYDRERQWLEDRIVRAGVQILEETRDGRG